MELDKFRDKVVYFITENGPMTLGGLFAEMDEVSLGDYEWSYKKALLEDDRLTKDDSQRWHLTDEVVDDEDKDS